MKTNRFFMSYTLSTLLFFVTLLTSCGKSEEQPLSIAILTPITHPSLEQIEMGFKQTIEAKAPGKYRFVTYNAQGNKTLMRSEIEEILQKDQADLVAIARYKDDESLIQLFNTKRC